MSIENESLVFDTEAGSPRFGPAYSRMYCTARRDLEHQILKNYGGGEKEEGERREKEKKGAVVSPDSHMSLIFPSGIASISCAVDAACREGSLETFISPTTGIETIRRSTMTLIHGDELYDDTHRTLKFVCDGQAPLIRRRSVDVRDTAGIIDIATKAKAEGYPVRVLFVEGCTNPAGNFPDVGHLSAVLKKLDERCLVVVDNTFLTAALCNPLELGADLVLESLTKYNSASSCIGGHLMGRDAVMAPFLKWHEVHGGFVGADHCELIRRHAVGLRARVWKAGASACTIATWLEEEQQGKGTVVDRVMHASLPSHPTHAVAARVLTAGAVGASGVVGPPTLWMHLRVSPHRVLRYGVDVLSSSDPSHRSDEDPPATAPDAAAAAAAARAVLEFKTSFGGAKSRIDPYRLAVVPVDFYDRVRDSSGGNDAESCSVKSINIDELDHDGADSDAEAQQVAGEAGGCWVRFSVGYEHDAAAIIEGLRHFLGNV